MGKKCFASSACWALDSYTSNGFSQRYGRDVKRRTLNAMMPMKTPRMKKRKAMMSQMTPHTCDKTL